MRPKDRVDLLGIGIMYCSIGVRQESEIYLVTVRDWSLITGREGAGLQKGKMAGP